MHIRKVFAKSQFIFVLLPYYVCFRTGCFYIHADIYFSPCTIATTTSSFRKSPSITRFVRITMRFPNAKVSNLRDTGPSTIPMPRAGMADPLPLRSHLGDCPTHIPAIAPRKRRPAAVGLRHNRPTGPRVLVCLSTLPMLPGIRAAERRVLGRLPSPWCRPGRGGLQV